MLDTLLADVDELHGQLQLPPLRPVGRVHGHQQGVEQSLNILGVLGLVFGHVAFYYVSILLCVPLLSDFHF